MRYLKKKSRVMILDTTEGDVEEDIAEDYTPKMDM